MIVVSDSTPLITLMKAAKLEVLHGLFGEVVIPDAVYSEVTTNEEFKAEADLIKKSSFLKVVSVNDNDRVDFLQRATGLDRGESEAIIVVADKTKADLLLMDEIAGRRIAQNMKIPITGSACILVRAFQTGLISKEEADNAFDMIRKSRRHISERLIQNALSMIHARD